jgi:hypothetical protein
MPKLNYALAAGEYDIGEISNRTINVPFIQCCVALIIRSDQHYAVAHFDTSQSIKAVMDKIIDTLQNDTNIKATIVGGDFGFILSSAEQLLKKVTRPLKDRNIAVTHDKYSISPMVTGSISTLACYMAMGRYGIYPNSIVGATAYTVSTIVSFLANELLMTNNFSIRFDAGSNNITINTNNLKIDSAMSRLLTAKQNETMKERFEDNPLLSERPMTFFHPPQLDNSGKLPSKQF